MTKEKQLIHISKFLSLVLRVELIDAISIVGIVVFKVAHNEQVLPMVGNFIFVRPELLPGFLIKLNIKN